MPVGKNSRIKAVTPMTPIRCAPGRCCYPDGIFTFEDSRVTKLNGST